MFTRSLLTRAQLVSGVRFYASKSIYVGNLPWSTTKEELTSLFSKYGQVQSVSIPIDPLGRSKGFGFVELNEEGVEQAVSEINETDFKGRTIRASVALNSKPAYTPRENKSNTEEPEPKEQ